MWRTKMEVLFEFGGTKIPLHLPILSELINIIQSEVRKYATSATVDCMEGDNSSKYLFEKWFQRWDTYVVVTNSSEVSDVDKLTFIMLETSCTVMNYFIPCIINLTSPLKNYFYMVYHRWQACYLTELWIWE